MQITETTNLDADLGSLADATPLAIDTRLAHLDDLRWTAVDNRERAIVNLMYTAGARKTYGRRADWTMTLDEALAVVRAQAENAERSWEQRPAADALAKVEETTHAVEVIKARMEPLQAEYRARRWTRSFLVTDGHAHSSMDCSTCNNGEYATRFAWLVEYAGRTEAEVVAAAGERACTACYPSAPVVPAGTSVMLTPDERTRAEQREQAAVAKAARLATKIAKGLTTDGSEFKVVYPGYNNRDATERFKTEQAAIQWLVQYTVWGDHGTENRKPAFDAIRAAIAAKHGQSLDEVDAMIAAKVAAKIKRDNR